MNESKWTTVNNRTFIPFIFLAAVKSRQRYFLLYLLSYGVRVFDLTKVFWVQHQQMEIRNGKMWKKIALILQKKKTEKTRTNTPSVHFSISGKIHTRGIHIVISMTFPMWKWEKFQQNIQILATHLQVQTLGMR